MTIASKILMSALLVGLSVPAFAQGPTTTGSTTAPAVATTKPVTVHKASSPVDVTKPAAKPIDTKATTAKTDAMKTDAMKPDAVKPDMAKGATVSNGTTVTTGITKPAVPMTASPAAPVIKTN